MWQDFREQHSVRSATDSSIELFFKIFRSFNRHYREYHSKTANVVCDVCQKVCKNKGAFKTHFASHLKVGSMECPYCGKLYKHQSGFVYHVRSVHTGKKLLFSCLSLSSHLHAFAGEKPYSCPFPDCGYRAVDFPNAMKHIKMVHKSTERPIKSETIPSSYKQIKKN
jgi:hypothetical protein